MTRRILFRVAAVLLLMVGQPASAQSLDRPLKVIVPIAAGSTTDFIARVVAEQLRASLGQTVLVENMAGAGGTIGTATAAKSAPDGLTLLVASSAHTVNPVLYKSLPYSTTGDFAGVSVLVTLPNILVTTPGKGINSVEDLVRQGRANPGKLSFGSGGVGSGAHMNAELFRAMAKFESVHVPYKGTPEVVNEIIAGRIDWAFVPITTALPHLRAGKLLPLAVGASSRTPLLPELRTTEEAGFASSAHNEWIGMYTRAGTPDATLRRLNREVVKALRDPVTAEKLATVGAAPAPSTPEEIDALVKSGIASVANTVRIAQIPTN